MYTSVSNIKKMFHTTSCKPSFYGLILAELKEQNKSNRRVFSTFYWTITHL